MAIYSPACFLSGLDHLHVIWRHFGSPRATSLLDPWTAWAPNESTVLKLKAHQATDLNAFSEHYWGKPEPAQIRDQGLGGCQGSSSEEWVPTGSFRCPSTWWLWPSIHLLRSRSLPAQLQRHWLEVYIVGTAAILTFPFLSREMHHMRHWACFHIKGKLQDQLNFISDCCLKTRVIWTTQESTWMVCIKKVHCGFWTEQFETAYSRSSWIQQVITAVNGMYFLMLISSSTDGKLCPAMFTASEFWLNNISNYLKCS